MSKRSDVVAYARSVIGCRYSTVPSGGIERASYNCSYLTFCAFRAAGLTIPSWQGHQNGDGSQSDWVYAAGHWTSDASKLKPGDLVFFGDSRTNTNHVGLVSVAGNPPKIIDSTPSRGVAERTLPVSAGFVGGGWPLKGDPDAKPLPKQVAGSAKNNNGLNYRSQVENVGWLDTVHDGQTSGTEGYSARLEALKIQPPKGLTLAAIAHIQNIGNVGYVGIDGTAARSGTQSSKADPIIGTVGRSLRLEAITFFVQQNTTGLTLYYQVHIQNRGWSDICVAGQTAGTEGKGLRIEAFRAWLAK